MRSFLRTFLLAGIPFGLFWVLWGLYFGSKKELLSAVWSGVIAAVIGGLVAAVLARYRENKVSESGPVFIDEVLLREVRAARDGISGRLYLTDRRVFFEGYPTDESSPVVATLFEGGDAEEPPHHVSIPILQIADVIVSQKLGVDSRVEIRTTEGRVESFAIEDPAYWAEDISTARQKYLDEPRSEEMKLFP